MGVLFCQPAVWAVSTSSFFSRVLIHNLCTVMEICYMMAECAPGAVTLAHHGAKTCYQWQYYHTYEMISLWNCSSSPHVPSANFVMRVCLYLVGKFKELLMWMEWPRALNHGCIRQSVAALVVILWKLSCDISALRIFPHKFMQVCLPLAGRERTKADMVYCCFLFPCALFVLLTIIFCCNVWFLHPVHVHVDGPARKGDL